MNHQLKVKLGSNFEATSKTLPSNSRSWPHLFRQSIVAIILSLVVIALFSYSNDDASLLNSLPGDSYHNLLGGIGANFAAFMLQSFGMIPSLVIMIYLGLLVVYISPQEKNKIVVVARICLFLVFSLILSSFLCDYLLQDVTDIEIYENIDHIINSGGFIGYYLTSSLRYSFDVLDSSQLLQLRLLIYSLGLVTGFYSLGLRFKLSSLKHILQRRFHPATAEHQSLEKPGNLTRNRQSLFRSDDTPTETAAPAAASIQHIPLNMEQESPENAHSYADNDSDRYTTPSPAAPSNSKPSPIETELPRPGRSIPLHSNRADHPVHPAPQPRGYDILPTSLLIVPEQIRINNNNCEVTPESLAQLADDLAQVLQDFGIKGQITTIHPGPVVTLCEFVPAPGVKSSRIISLADDIARSMFTKSARVAVIPGKNAIGIELPNKQRQFLHLREILEDRVYTNNNANLPLILGKNISGEPIIADLAKMPHLLVAGTTGSGKSVAINTMVLSLLYKYKPEECKMVMIDPKMLELSVYDGIPHLITPVVTNPKKAITALRWVVNEMESRYRAMTVLGVRNISGYNNIIRQSNGEKITKVIQTGFDPATKQPLFSSIDIESTTLPYIVVIVDEMADLMLVAGKEIEGYIQRLAQMARAAGIHIIMATQRPSVDVITGVIKANFPTRISFQVTSKIDSRTILGEMGAEQLLGMGDMLYMMPGGQIERAHGPFVDDHDVERVANFLRANGGAPQYIDIMSYEENDDTSSNDDNYSAAIQDADDSLYQRAVEIIRRDKKVSISYIQRCLRIGYNRAAMLIERMEEEGVISPANSVGKREIL